MTKHEQMVRAALIGAAQEQCDSWSISERFIKEVARRLEVKPEPPPKKVWSVHPSTAEALRMSVPLSPGVGGDVGIVNRFASCIIRERPDLVAAEWERRYRKEHECVASGSFYGSERDVAAARTRLFPELDP